MGVPAGRYVALSVAGSTCARTGSSTTSRGATRTSRDGPAVVTSGASSQVAKVEARLRPPSDVGKVGARKLTRWTTSEPAAAPASSQASRWRAMSRMPPSPSTTVQPSGIETARSSREASAGAVSADCHGHGRTRVDPVAAVGGRVGREGDDDGVRRRSGRRLGRRGRVGDGTGLRVRARLRALLRRRARRWSCIDGRGGGLGAARFVPEPVDGGDDVAIGRPDARSRVDVGGGGDRHRAVERLAVRRRRRGIASVDVVARQVARAHARPVERNVAGGACRGERPGRRRDRVVRDRAVDPRRIADERGVVMRPSWRRTGCRRPLRPSTRQATRPSALRRRPAVQGRPGSRRAVRAVAQIRVSSMIAVEGAPRRRAVARDRGPQPDGRRAADVRRDVAEPALGLEPAVEIEPPGASRRRSRRRGTRSSRRAGWCRRPDGGSRRRRPGSPRRGPRTGHRSPGTSRAGRQRPVRHRGSRAG